MLPRQKFPDFNLGSEECRVQLDVLLKLREHVREPDDEHDPTDHEPVRGLSIQA